MEYFDIVDEQGNPTGQTVRRKQIRIETIYFIGLRMSGSQAVEIPYRYFCRKGAWKKTPKLTGCYDISSAGHIPAGVDYIPSALRRL